MKYERYIKEGTLAWTLTSNGYKYMTWNLALQWKRARCSAPLCIVCADKPSFQFLQREGISCCLWDEALADFGPLIVPFGSRQFSTLNRLKLSLLHKFSQDPNIQRCIYLDGDIAVYKDIVGDLCQRLTGSDVLAQCDEQGQTCSGECPNFCTGILAWNHGADKGCFRITDMLKWSEKPEDQVWVNGSVKECGTQVTILPRDEYPNGARLTLTHTTPELKEKAFCLHYNYRVGESKKSDMKRFGDWHLPY